MPRLHEYREGPHQFVACLPTQLRPHTVDAVDGVGIGFVVGAKRREQLRQLPPVGVEVLFEQWDDLVVPNELQRRDAVVPVEPRDAEQVAVANLVVAVDAARYAPVQDAQQVSQAQDQPLVLHGRPVQQRRVRHHLHEGEAAPERDLEEGDAPVRGVSWSRSRKGCRGR